MTRSTRTISEISKWKSLPDIVRFADRLLLDAILKRFYCDGFLAIYVSDKCLDQCNEHIARSYYVLLRNFAAVQGCLERRANHSPSRC